MKSGFTLIKTLFALALAACWHPATARACAACYGQSDSPLAQGFNWGILSLLGVVALVLGSIAGFFVYLARRAAAHPVLPEVAENPTTGH